MSIFDGVSKEQIMVINDVIDIMKKILKDVKENNNAKIKTLF
ncbi:hypothetical protein SD457_10695 [Coprobacillaceae bacterium CR2/5/TPMF4]|nr:hypothetical protein SD457_10695 [Coprobacillaceae bacterium CR2/5/TPMF4]